MPTRRTPAPAPATAAAPVHTPVADPAPSPATPSPWRLYDPDAPAAASRVALPAPPPWRVPGEARRRALAQTFRPDAAVVQAVNVALHLRRPLLVTGNPGTGKSSLVFSIAQQLALGPVLVWPINSRATLADGLYRHDALARLQHLQERQAAGAAPPTRAEEADALGRFITLGPLGSALADARAPRALLIDEIDKSDVDLPHDLLHVLDTGQFEIPELRRVADTLPEVPVLHADGSRVVVKDGVVSFREFPLIVMTSNGERDFPAPFLRRCVPCSMPDPDRSHLLQILRAHFPALVADDALGALLDDFLARRGLGALATDQLLNAQHLATWRQAMTPVEQAQVLDVLLRALDAG